MRIGATVAAYLRRDFAVSRSYRLGFALQVAAGLIALYVIFQVSKLVAPRGFAHTSGIHASYFAWIVVGLAVSRLVDAAVGSAAVRVRAEQSTGTLEAVLATPVRPGLALLASTAYDLVRAMVQATLLLLLATVAFGMRTDTSPSGAAAAAAAAFAVLAGLSSLGVLVAAVALVAKQIPNVPALLSGILLIVSGLWFPIGLAPRWIAAVGRVSPVYWALEVVREGLLANHVRIGLLLGAIGFAAVALPFAVLVYGAIVRHVRHVGTLPFY